MTTITLLSDLGEQSTLVMRAKGQLSGLLPQGRIVDLTHSIEPGDLREAAYALNEVMDGFPDKTIHLVAIGNSRDIIATEVHGQIVISPRHELLSMLDHFTGNVRFFTSDREVWHVLPDAMVEAAVGIVNHGMDLEKWGEKLTDYETKDMPLSVITEDELKGVVIRTDDAGNIFTNISKTDVERLSDGGAYRIVLSRHEWVDHISAQMNEGKNGMITCSFSHKGHLVISVNNGSAKQLLGLGKGSVIRIEKL